MIKQQEIVCDNNLNKIIIDAINNRIVVATLDVSMSRNLIAIH